MSPYNKPKSASRLFAAVLAACMMLALGGGLLPARAQSSQEQSALLDQLRLLRLDIKDLQIKVFGGKNPRPRATTQTEITVTTSDVTKAAADAEDRFSAFEEQIQTLTGALERFGHKIAQTRSRLDKLVLDIDFRLSAIEQKITPGGGAQITGPADQQGQAVDGAAAALPAGAPGGTQVVVSANAPGTKVLGTIPAGDVGAATTGVPTPRPEPAKPKSVLPQGSVQERYSYAFKLVRQFKTAEAEVAFIEFLAAHGDDPLADNARYWLGESYYAQRDYAQAAATFVEAYSKAPNGPKARDNLLKLGMSLSRLDQKESACESLDQMLSQFNSPADAKTRTKAEVEKKRAGCN